MRLITSSSYCPSCFLPIWLVTSPLFLPNVLSAHISPAYLFCLALGSSAFYYTNHSNTSSNLLASQKLLIRGNARVVCGKTAAVKIAHTPVCVLVCFTDERNKSTLLKDSC